MNKYAEANIQLEQANFQLEEQKLNTKALIENM